MFSTAAKMNEDYPYIRSIVKTLGSVARPGSFANGGSFLLPLPVLQFNKVEGIARLPVSECEAKEIIAICSQAPYGRGEETIVDTAVRNTWQLDPSQFTIKNPQWDSYLESLAAVVKKELGCDPALTVNCELYKFLLYEQGSFFKSRRDTEKVANMFGTLVIQLPSDYDGGLLRVCHRGEEKTFNFSGLEGMSGFHYAAFYADCEHELCMVTRGCRLCLVYNLVYSGGDTCPAPIDYHQVSDRVIAGLTEWEQQDDNSLPIMAYMLNHKYCEANLSFQHLKGADQAVADVLIEASKQKSIGLYLGIVTMYENIFPKKGMEQPEIEDVCIEIDVSHSFTADNLVSPAGDKIKSSIMLSHSPVISKDLFKNAEPGSTEFKATSDYTFTMDKTYCHTALLVWPKKHQVAALGIRASISELESVCKKLASLVCESEADRQQTECENLAKDIIAVCRKPCVYFEKEEARTILLCLQQLDGSLTCQCLTAIADNFRLWYHAQESLADVVIQKCNAYSWEKFEPGLIVLFKSAVLYDIRKACALLSALANTGIVSSQQLKVCQKLVDIIYHALISEQGVDSRFGTCFEVCELFKSFSVLQCEDQLETMLQQFFKQPERYPVTTTLVTAAIELHESVPEGSRPLYTLLSHCVNRLEQLTLKELDWSCIDSSVECSYELRKLQIKIDSEMKCSCKLCEELKTFLMDPVKQVARFDVDSDRCDTSRKFTARPYHGCISCQEEVNSGQCSLFVTKEQQLFKAKEQDRLDKLNLLARISLLLEVPKENPPKRLKTTE